MKTFPLFALALLPLSLAASADVDLGSVAGGTPYDPHMRPVKEVLSGLGASAASMDRVQKLMREGRSFRYFFSEPYTAALPAVTEKRQAGDCKAKALWLCDQLGDQHCRFVVGKAHLGAKLSHAWVLWQEQGGRWYILDCTNYSTPIPAETVSPRDYIPLYSWTKNGVYRHAATQIGMTAVAGKRSAPVATASRARRCARQ